MLVFRIAILMIFLIKGLVIRMNAELKFVETGPSLNFQPDNIFLSSANDSREELWNLTLEIDQRPDQD